MTERARVRLPDASPKGFRRMFPASDDKGARKCAFLKFSGGGLVFSKTGIIYLCIAESVKAVYRKERHADGELIKQTRFRVFSRKDPGVLSLGLLWPEKTQRPGLAAGPFLFPGENLRRPFI